MTRTALVLLLGASAGWAATAEENRALLRSVFERLREGETQRNEYPFTRYSSRKELAPNGSVKEGHTTVSRNELRNGASVLRVIERDGKPVPQEETPAQARETPIPDSQRKAREQRQPGGNAWLLEFPDATDCRVTGEEAADGRPALALECTPHAGYRPKSTLARVFAKMRSRLWIDKSDSQLAKAEGTVFEPVTIGWGLVGKVEKGTEFHIQRKRMPAGAWLSSLESIRVDARILFKSMRLESENRWDYQAKQE